MSCQSNWLNCHLSRKSWGGDKGCGPSAPVFKSSKSDCKELLKICKKRSRRHPHLRATSLPRTGDFQVRGNHFCISSGKPPALQWARWAGGLALGSPNSHYISQMCIPRGGAGHLAHQDYIQQDHILPGVGLLGGVPVAAGCWDALVPPAPPYIRTGHVYVLHIGCMSPWLGSACSTHRATPRGDCTNRGCLWEQKDALPSVIANIV